MGKSPGKWIKAVLFGKKSSKSNLSKDGTIDKKTSITSKPPSKDFDDDSMVISSPVPLVMHAGGDNTEIEKTTSCNLTSDTPDAVRSNLGLDIANKDEYIKLEQAAIMAQTAFRGYLARRAFWALKSIIRIQAHIRGWLVRRKELNERLPVPNLEDNLVNSVESEKPTVNLRKVSSQQTKSVQEQSHSELEKVKHRLRKISVSGPSSKLETRSDKASGSQNSDASEQGTDQALEKVNGVNDEMTDLPQPELVPVSHDVLQDNNHLVETESPEMNGKECNFIKENQKTRRRKSFPAKQEDQPEIVIQTTPALPSYMAATESAKAKLRAQAAAKAAEDGAENGFVRRHSLPSSTGKLSLQSPRVQKPGWNKSNKPQISARDDKTIQTGWKR